MLALAALVVSVALGVAPDDRRVQEAERLAREGRSRAALERFEQIAADRPEDVEVRLWIARLLRRTGQPARAEIEFRRAMDLAPRHVEALWGLAAVVASQGRTDEAIRLLDRAEEIAPDDAGVLATRALCLRWSGQSAEAERFYARAAALSPHDGEIRAGWDQIRRLNRHRVEMAFRQEAHGDGLPSASVVDAAADARTSERLRIHGRVQAQRRFTREEVRGGGGLEWRATPDVLVRGAALFGPGADVIARSDVQVEAEHVRGRLEGSTALRRMSFADARVWIVTPVLTLWADDRTAITVRYFGSATAFDGGDSAVDHSGAVRLRRSLTPRLWIDASFSRGHESLDTLSADRLATLRADTWAGGVLYHLRGVQSIAASLEYQRRSDGRTVVSVTAGAVHRF